MLSWTHICSTVEPGSSLGYKHMYSDPVPLISISSLNLYLANLRYFLSSWAHISYSLHFLTLQRTWGEHLSPVLCLTYCAQVSFGRTLSVACLPSISPAQSDICAILTVYRQLSPYRGTAGNTALLLRPPCKSVEDREVSQIIVANFDTVLEA